MPALQLTLPQAGWAGASSQRPPAAAAAATAACPTAPAVLPSWSSRPRLQPLRAASAAQRPQLKRRRRLCLAAQAAAGDEAMAPPPTAALALSSSDSEATAATFPSSGSDGEETSGGGCASSDGDGGVRIDLELPRRSLLVQFTCNACEGRSERLVNPVAWHKGLVIAQCQHCKAWHKLADAANLVEEIRYADLEDE